MEKDHSDKSWYHRATDRWVNPAVKICSQESLNSAVSFNLDQAFKDLILGDNRLREIYGKISSASSASSSSESKSSATSSSIKLDILDQLPNDMLTQAQKVR